MATKKEFIQSSQAYLPRAAQQGLFALPRRREFLVEHVGEAPKRVLDVGCAGGYISLMLEKLGHKVTGIELNAKMAAEARARGIHVLEHDLEEPLPIPDGAYDVVHACEIIEHLFDTESFLSELYRVLIPDGMLILSTPNLNSFMNRFRVLFGRPLPMWGAYPRDRHGSHVRVFNQKKIVELLRRVGFVPDVMIGMNQPRHLKVFNAFPSWSEMILIKAIKEKGR